VRVLIILSHCLCGCPLLMLFFCIDFFAQTSSPSAPAHGSFHFSSLSMSPLLSVSIIPNNTPTFIGFGPSSSTIKHALLFFLFSFRTCQTFPLRLYRSAIYFSPSPFFNHTFRALDSILFFLPLPFLSFRLQIPSLLGFNNRDISPLLEQLRGWTLLCLDNPKPNSSILIAPCLSLRSRLAFNCSLRTDKRSLIASFFFFL